MARTECDTDFIFEDFSVSRVVTYLLQFLDIVLATEYLVFKIYRYFIVSYLKN